MDSDAKKRREQIASAVLAGFATTYRLSADDAMPELQAIAATRAVEWADALIAEMDKRGENR
jgi:predicted DNA-binding ribbon-helix-helix protein